MMDEIGRRVGGGGGLRVERSGTDALVSVSDDGRGIPEKKLGTLFEAAKTPSQGGSDGKKNMGIGLSVCRTIVKAHGGEMQARNNESGAYLCFTLPLKEGKPLETQG